MGQSFSSANNLHVYLDQPYYSPGDVVNGQVLLNCVEAFQANALVLKVEGYESVRWDETWEVPDHDADDRSMRTRMETTPRFEKKQFFQVQMKLQEYPSQVYPGQYQFPFTFTLPFGLPGSFDYTDSQTYSGSVTYSQTEAKIRYKAEAVCEVPGLLKPNIRGKAYMVVHQQMPMAPSQVVESTSQSIKACCCVNKGHAAMSANVQKDSYLPGEAAQVVLQVDNQSSSEFSRVELRLVRKITLSPRGAGYREVEDTLAEAKFPGVMPHEHAQGSQARLLSLQLPGDLLPTALGEVVQCDYQLLVLLKAASKITSDARLKLPITIYPGPPMGYVQYTAPPVYWQPSYVAPTAQVVLPSAPPLAPAKQVMGKLCVPVRSVLAPVNTTKAVSLAKQKQQQPAEQWHWMQAVDIADGALYSDGSMLDVGSVGI